MDRKKIEKNKLAGRAFAYLDIISWLESKIYGLNVQDIIRAKYLERKNTASATTPIPGKKENAL